jgi:hypothetical protein
MDQNGKKWIVEITHCLHRRWTSVASGRYQQCHGLSSTLGKKRQCTDQSSQSDIFETEGWPVKKFCHVHASNVSNWYGVIWIIKSSQG